MVLALASTSVTAPTSNSSMSVILIVKLCVEKLVSSLAARTVMLCEVALSASRAPATVTTPVLASMANRPPALSSRV